MILIIWISGLDPSFQQLLCPARSSQIITGLTDSQAINLLIFNNYVAFIVDPINSCGHQRKYWSILRRTGPKQNLKAYASPMWMINFIRWTMNTLTLSRYSAWYDMMLLGLLSYLNWQIRRLKTNSWLKFTDKENKQ